MIICFVLWRRRRCYGVLIVLRMTTPVSRRRTRARHARSTQRHRSIVNPYSDRWTGVVRRRAQRNGSAGTGAHAYPHPLAKRLRRRFCIARARRPKTTTHAGAAPTSTAATAVHASPHDDVRGKNWCRAGRRVTARPTDAFPRAGQPARPLHSRQRRRPRPRTT